MNATRLASLSAALIIFGLAAVGCAHETDRNRGLQSSAPVRPVAAEAVIEQRTPVAVYIAPSYVAPETANRVIVRSPPAQDAAMTARAPLEPMLTERAPRADRN